MRKPTGTTKREEKNKRDYKTVQQSDLHSNFLSCTKLRCQQIGVYMLLCIKMKRRRDSIIVERNKSIVRPITPHVCHNIHTVESKFFEARRPAFLAFPILNAKACCSAGRPSEPDRSAQTPSAQIHCPIPAPTALAMFRIAHYCTSHTIAAVYTTYTDSLYA